MSNYEQFFKLESMLKEAGIPFERQDASYGLLRIHYPRHANPETGETDFICSAICGNGTYGFEHGLLEIMGLLTPEEEEFDSVVGYLTADDVFKRIKSDWEKRNEK